MYIFYVWVWVFDIVSVHIFENFEKCWSGQLHSLPSDQIILKAIAKRLQKHGRYIQGSNQQNQKIQKKKGEKSYLKLKYELTLVVVYCLFS